MGTQVLPSLPGITWDIDRTEIWNNQQQEAVSGADTLIAYWTYPKHQWKLKWDFLRQGTRDLVAYTEFAQLIGFFNARQGNYDSFLYTCEDFNSATGQGIGTGDGTNRSFQLAASEGGFAEPILAPNVVSTVYVDGSPVSNTTYSVNAWGSSAPGTILFGSGHAPAAGKAVTADFTFYFPCRFDDPTMTFTKFYAQLYNQQGISFTSIKLGVAAS